MALDYYYNSADEANNQDCNQNECSAFHTRVLLNVLSTTQQRNKSVSPQLFHTQTITHSANKAALSHSLKLQNKSLDDKCFAFRFGFQTIVNERVRRDTCKVWHMQRRRADVSSWDWRSHAHHQHQPPQATQTKHGCQCLMSWNSARKPGDSPAAPGPSDVEGS